MAKVKDPLRSSEARGKIGGTIYNTCRGARYVKTFTAPAQPRTPNQLNVRGLMQRSTRAWRSISAVNRGLWDDYGAAHTEIDGLGSTLAKSGFNWFCRLTTRLLWRVKAQVDTPPSTAAPDTLIAFAVTGGAGQVVCTWTATAGSDKEAQFIQVGPHSAGVKAKRNKGSFMAYENGETGTKTISGLSPGSWTIFARIMDEDNGLISTYMSATGVVT